MRQIAVSIPGLSLGLGMLVEWLKFGPEWIADVAYAIAIIAGGWFNSPRRGVRCNGALFRHERLYDRCSCGALLIQQWSEGAAVTFLFALRIARSLQSSLHARLFRRSCNSRRKPPCLKTARRFVKCPVEVAVGATITVKSGAIVPLDGEVLKEPQQSIKPPSGVNAGEEARRWRVQGTIIGSAPSSKSAPPKPAPTAP